MAGDATLFMRRDAGRGGVAVRHADPRTAGRSERVRDLPEYQCGTWGPLEADRLIEPDGRHWRSL